MAELPKNPWDYVSMDFSSASDVHNWKALVLTDNNSRFLMAIPMDKTDTEAVKRALKRIFNTYSIPKTMKADNGLPFNSAELQKWLKDEWDVKLIHSTPLNPTENGLVERSMQGINQITAIAKLESHLLSLCLDEQFEESYQITVQTTNKKLMESYGIEIRLLNSSATVDKTIDGVLRMSKLRKEMWFSFPIRNQTNRIQHSRQVYTKL
ncbi:uncharacterized protein LOC129743011 [Uranotaenia lowii]|uniref:uncharacterized protein LOC129743011 n=1 Tax=Uranotaenia lowii TaxID=190385 RepID=UPI002479E78F|nr:uncharacterized protein LOC129743011 [Uranotaenia lowii]